LTSTSFGPLPGRRAAAVPLAICLAASALLAATAPGVRAQDEAKVIKVPRSIDATCATGVSADLRKWIRAQPDGSTLRFPKGSCYLLTGDEGIHLGDRSGFTLDGRGSTLLLRTNGESNLSSAFFFERSDNIRVLGFHVDGGNAATATVDSDEVLDEQMNGAAVRAGTSAIEFDGVTWDRLRGFGVIISDDGEGPAPTDITVRDSTIRGAEMGVAVVTGSHIRIVNNAILDTVYTAIDLEPDQDDHGYQDVLIEGNRIDRYGWAEGMTGWFVAANPADEVVDDVTMDDLVVRDNCVVQGAATMNNGGFPGLGGLGIRADKDNIKRGITITGNRTADDDTQGDERSVMHFAHVEDLVITDNHQPIGGGAKLVRDVDGGGARDIRDNDVTPDPVASALASASASLEPESSPDPGPCAGVGPAPITSLDVP
jgi:hypothetical protein